MDIAPLAFLVDVDNTLLDNDRFQHDLRAHITAVSGQEASDRYWAIQAGLFESLGYRDYLGAFQAFKQERPSDPDAIWLAGFVMDYPFAPLLYPGALDLLARLRAIGPTVALTDGDATFQPRKLVSAGLADALDRRVMIFVHKEHELAAIEARCPARHYVVIDDKIRILTAFKQAWGDKVTTVFPRQGQFGTDPAVIAANPPADHTVGCIGELLAPGMLERIVAGRV